jgi:hypothetical protein
MTLSAIHPNWDYTDYPLPKDHTTPYVAKKEPANPALRNLPLKIASAVLPHVPGLPGVFYKNAGWPTITKLGAIGDVDARYSPLVIPTGAQETQLAGAYTDPMLYANVTEHSEKSAFYSVHDFHQAYKNGKTTPSAVVEALLPLIRRDIATPSKYSRAWVDINFELVRAAAEASTERWKAGKPLGILDGVPVGVKDEMDVKGYYKKNLGTTNNYTNALDETSWCVALWEKEGAVLLGKMNMHGM